MARHVLVVFTNPTSPEQEAEFNDWYDNIHLDEVVSIPGFISAQRFKLSHDTAAPMPGPYLALYEMETDDAHAATAVMQGYANDGTMNVSAAMHPVDVAASVFTPITGLVKSTGKVLGKS